MNRCSKCKHAEDAHIKFKQDGAEWTECTEPNCFCSTERPYLEVVLRDRNTGELI